MVDYEKLTGLSQEEIRKISYHLTATQRNLKRYNYYATLPTVRAAAIICSINNVNRTLERIAEALEGHNRE